MRRRRFWGLSAATVLVALTACGTRLPNSAFVQAGQTASNQSTGAAANNTTSNGTSDNSGLAAGSGSTGSGNGSSGATSGSGSTGSGAAASTSGSGSSASGAGSSAGSSSASGTGSSSGSSAGSSGPNTASDIGVTETSIKIGNVTGVGGPLGPDAFGPTLNGLKTWVAATNAKGGINGRKIDLATCDDGQDGARNLSCVQKLVTQDKVFMFLDNNSLTTAPSASFEYSHGVPDLGLPLNNGYYKYPNMFSLYGVDYPRDSKQVGVNGNGYNTTEVYRYFKQVVGVTRGAFFFYSQQSSLAQARSEEQQATAEGICQCYESGGHGGEQIGAANWDADVLSMKNKNVDGVFDAVDVAANQSICSSMDRYGVKVKAKESTIEVWSQDIGTAGWSVPCRDSVYATGSTTPYSDTSLPVVAQFRQDFNTYAHGALLHQWAFDGYAAAQIFGDALTAMGSSPTRKGFIDWMDAIKPYTYTDHGMFHDVDWTPRPHPNTRQTCGSVVQWQDSAGTFVNRAGAGHEFFCYTTTEISFPYVPDGS